MTMAIVSRAHSSERTHYRVTFAVLALADFPYGLLSLVTPALPLLQHALHASPGATAWLLTGYLLSGSVATPLIGRLGAIYGKKRILVPTLAALADTDNLFVIDDAAQAHGATYGSSSSRSHT